VFSGIGPTELIVVLAIALLLLGPKRLPDAGRSLGKGLREFKGAISGSDRDEDDDEITVEVPQHAGSRSAG
jgi:sec-independent protein translocase protein TatA